MNKNYLYCFITIVFFSTIEVAGKVIGDSIPPVSITIIRFFIGGLIMLPFALYQVSKEKRCFRSIDFLRLAIPGVLNVAISMFLLQLAIYYGRATITAILISSNPIFVAIFGYMILKEKLSVWRVWGIFAGLVGMILVVFAEKEITGTGRNMVLGVIFGVLASISFGLYTVVSKKYVRTYGNFLLNSFSFISGAMILLISALLVKTPIQFEITLKSIAILAYMGVFITGISYLLFFEALKNIPTAHGSMFFYLKPAIASLLAFFILKESLHYFQLIGFILILIGLNSEKLKVLVWRRK